MNATPKRLPPLFRGTLVVLGVLGLTLLVKARQLEPDPRDFGTHEQLGLTPCYFQKSTGHVCPMCGCTTAWAHLLRGEVAQATTHNLGGLLLCVAVGIGSALMLLTAARGQWPITQPSLKSSLLMATAWLAVVVLDWLRRIY